MPTCRYGCHVSTSATTHATSLFGTFRGHGGPWRRRRHGLYGFGYVKVTLRLAAEQDSSVCTYPHVVFFAGSSSEKGSKQMLQQSLSRSSNSSSLHFSKPFPTSSGDRLGEASDAALGSCSSFFCVITRLIVRETSDCTASPTSIGSTSPKKPSTTVLPRHRHHVSCRSTFRAASFAVFFPANGVTSGSGRSFKEVCRSHAFARPLQRSGRVCERFALFFFWRVLRRFRHQLQPKRTGLNREKRTG